MLLIKSFQFQLFNESNIIFHTNVIESKTAVEGIQSYNGAVYTGASITWIERQFGYVFGIALINSG